MKNRQHKLQSSVKQFCINFLFLLQFHSSTENLIFLSVTISFSSETWIEKYLIDFFSFDALSNVMMSAITHLFPVSKKNFITQTIESRRRASERCVEIFSFFHHHHQPLSSSILVSRIRVVKNLRWKLKIMLFKMIPSTQLKRRAKAKRWCNSSIWVISYASIAS